MSEAMAAPEGATIQDAMEAAAESPEVNEVSSKLSEVDNGHPIDVGGEAAPEGEVAAETEAELQEEISDAIDNGATPEDIKDMVKEFKLKVNGKEISKKIDLSDEEALKRELQLSAAGQSAMQELAEIKKLYTQEIDRLKKNPWDFMKDYEMDPDELMNQRIQEKLTEMEMSPEELEKQKMQKEYEDARARVKELEEEKTRIEQEKIQQEEFNTLNTDIKEALSAHKSLPNTRRTAVRIAEHMLWAMQNGFENVSVQDVLPSVESEMESELNEFMSELPEEMMEKYIGKKNIDRMRQKRLNQMKKGTAETKTTPSPSVNKPQKGPKEKINSKDFFKNPNKYLKK